MRVSEALLDGISEVIAEDLTKTVDSSVEKFESLLGSVLDEAARRKLMWTIIHGVARRQLQQIEVGFSKNG